MLKVHRILLLISAVLSSMWLFVTPVFASTPTINGTIAGGEYGTHTDGFNQQTNGGQTVYVTWDATNLYIAYVGANTSEGVVLYVDTNPIVPANGGTNSNGNLTGQNYDSTNFSALPFRANFVTYFKNGYREYRTSNGSGGWSGATTGFGSYADNGSNVRELAIPWSAMGGQPTSFNFFSYATSSGGFVYGQVPTGNSGGSIGTSASYSNYYLVASTSAPSYPFAANSTAGYCYATADNNVTTFNSANAQAVRDAISAASAGDTVKVAGYCAGVSGSEVANVTKVLTIQGGYTTTNWTTASPGVYTATLDALGGGRVLYSTDNITVENVSLQNGYISGNQSGGGLYINGTLVMSHSEVYSNVSTSSGGGAYITGDTLITNSRVVSNQGSFTTSGSHGGGIRVVGFTTLNNTDFYSNAVRAEGGGIYAQNGATVTGGIFYNNRSVSTGSGGGVSVSAFPLIISGTSFISNSTNQHAGAIHGNADITVTNAYFEANSTPGQGGAVGGFGSSYTAYIYNSIFRNNTSGGNGGAIGLEQAIIISNSLLAANTSSSNGEGIYGGNSLTLMHTTIASPTQASGAAIYINGGTANITNTIIASHTTGIQRNSGTVRENYNLFYGNTTHLNGTITSGGNSIMGNPAFYNTSNYTLTSSSLAINRGTNLGLTSDYFGDARPQMTLPDIGYDESPYSLVGSCYAKVNNGALTYVSTDAQAVRDAISAASAGDTVKVAGYCAGVSGTEVVAVSKVLTIQGGYTTTNWTTSDFTNNVTTLDALAGGRVVNATSSITVSNIKLQNGALTGAGQHGAGIYTAQPIVLSNIIVYSSNTVGSSTNGGAAYLGSSANITGSSFISNSATNAGGAVIVIGTAYITNSGFLTNSAVFGGGAYFNGTSYVMNSSFMTNTSTNYAGGVWFNSSAIVTSTTFLNNVTVNHGGGAYFNTTASITGSTFTSNRGTIINSQGGGAYFLNTTNVTNTTFTSNTAGFGGGARFIVLSNLVNSTFTSNTATFMGGGASFVISATISGSTFTSNAASNNEGGGVYVSGALVITNSNFYSNTSRTNGGSVYGASTVEVSSGSFQYNRCTNSCSGGALAATDNLSITGTQFMNNSSNINGGALIGDSNITITNGYFANNSAGGSGGALVNFGAATTMWLSNSTFISNTSTNEGGGIYHYGAAYITATTFTNNQGSNGGGIYFTQANSRQLVNVLFARNHATSNGAGIYVDNTSVLQVIHTTIASPTVSTKQGIYVNSGTVYVTNTIIASHTTGIERAGGTVSENYNLFYGNSANTSGSVTSGGNSLQGSPAFYDTTYYTLTASSAAIDQGTNLNITSDYFGDVRPYPNSNSLPDMGYDESIYTTGSCYATRDNGTTVYTSFSAQAVRDAINAASAGDTVKVAGYCAGVATQSGTNQVVYIDKVLTIAGGYTTTNWLTYNSSYTPTLDALGGGRVVYATEAATLQNIQVQNGKITGSPEYGGGIYTNQPMTLTQVMVYSNVVAGANGYGGGAYLQNVSTVTGTTFMSNTASWAGGGALFSNIATVTNTTFLNNAANDSGGGAYFTLGATVINSSFLSNTAVQFGGGAFFNDVATVTGGTFQSNSGSQSGGARFNGATDISGTTFFNNIATSLSGGGARFNTGPILMTATTFMSNSATTNGGGAEFAGAATILNSTFISNTALNRGGGVSADSSVVMSSSYFTNNLATGNVGGGLRVAGTLDDTGSLFYNNQATNNSNGNGGGLYAAVAARLTNTQFMSNSVYKNGGGGYFNGGVTADNIQVLTNTVTVGGSIEGGGGFYLSGSNHIANSLFQNNRMAANFGGGIYLANGVNNKLWLTSTSFISNFAKYGGGLESYFSSAITVTNSQFLSNTAFHTGGTAGGGLNHEGASALITGTLFQNNQVFGNSGSSNGGGLRITAGTAFIMNSQFIGNSAANVGGGISLEGAGGFTMTNLLLARNTVTNNGAAIYVSNASAIAHIRHTTIASPTVGTKQGIYVNNGTAYITNTIVASYATGIQRNGGTVSEDYNLFYGNSTANLNGTITSGGNSIGGNPMFVSPSSDNYKLSDGSLAVNYGTDLGVTSDFEGEARPQVTLPDIGYDESPYTQATGSCYAKVNSGALFVSNDAQAVRDAISAASVGDTVKVAGYCAGVSGSQVANVTKVLTIAGGYTTTNWTTSDFTNNVTTLDALGGGRVINASQALTVTDIQLQNGVATGTGGGLNSSAALVLSNVVVYSNTATGNGGGVYAGNTALFTATTFMSNTATTGGGSYISGVANITGVTVTNNKSTNSAGGIWFNSTSYLTNSTFMSNTTTSGHGGGTWFDASGTIITTTFINNVAASQGGGAFFNSNTLLSTLMNTTFISNSATRGGGAASNNGPLLSSSNGFTSNVASTTDGGGLYTGNMFTDTNSIFYNNRVTASNGGGARIGGAAWLVNTQFISNTAQTQSGGGVYVGGAATITNGTFTSNTAGNSGGGAYMNSVLTMTGGTFMSNTSASFGGGLYGANAAILTSTTFTSNSTVSNWGGGAYFNNGSQPITLTSVTFTLNNAASSSGRGGGLFTNNGSSTTYLSNTTFISNTAGDGGGAQIQGGVTIEASSFVSNTAMKLPDGAGGGLYASSTAVITNSSFSKNVTLGNIGDGGGARFSASTTVYNSTFSNNTAARHGGGAYLGSTSQPITLTLTTFTGNIATGSGSGAYLGGNSTITESIFSGNTSTAGWGGGLQGGNSAIITLTNSQFMSNTAANGGGGINHDGSSAVITGSLFHNNSASTNSGGGFRMPNGGAIMTNTQFISNSGTDGGGIYTQAGTWQVANVLLARNNATTGNGAGLYISGGTVTIMHTTIASPTQSTKQAIYVTGGTVYVTNTIIASHTTGINRTGGSVYENNNLFYGNTTNLNGTITSGGSSFISDPMFIAPSSDNYHLQSNSPAGGVGQALGVITDIDGDARNLSSPAIGMDEVTGGSLACYTTLNSSVTTTYSSSNAAAIWSAISAATNGDTIKVAGYCAGVAIQGGTLQTAYVNKNLTIRGGYTTTNWTTPNYTTNATTLDALGAGRVISANVAITLQGFTATNGYLNAGSSTLHGGGIYATSAATLTNMVVYSNVITGTSGTQHGGGVYVGGMALFSTTILSGNVARSDGGGGYFLGTAYLTNTTFTNNTANSALNLADGGGGGYFIGAAYLTNTTFTNNTAANSVGGGGYFNGATYILDTTFSNNTAASFSGGLYVSNTLYVTNSSFISNTSLGAGGGAIYQRSNTMPMTLYNVTAISNTANSWGGAVDSSLGPITIISSTFTYNTARNNDGGALNLNGVTHLTGTIISNNSAGIYGGGAIFNTLAYITGTTFTSNTSGSHGGGLYANNALTLTNGIFSQNSSGRGGGLYVNNGTVPANISNTTFTYNQAITHGGGFFLGNLVIGTIDTVSVLSNTASGLGGGAVFATSSNNVVRNTTFSNNVAGTNGGGIHTDGALQITNTTFISNKATGGLGGGIYFATASTHAITNALFARNQANTSGAAIYVVDATRLSLVHTTIASPTIVGNQAIYVANGTVNITNTIIASHTTGLQQAGGSVTQSSNLFYGNGTTLNGVSGSSWVADPLFIAPSSDNYHLQNTSPAGSAGEALGVTTDIDGDARSLSVPAMGMDEVTGLLACYTTLNASTTTTYSSSNAAALRLAINAASAGDTVKVAGYCAGATTQSGSTQIALITKTLAIRGGYTTTNWTTSDFTNNVTTLDALGGGRVMNVTTVLTVENIKLQNGTIAGSGGGINSSATTLVLSNVNIYSNSATSGSGGGVNISSGTAILTNSQFISNTAANQGGGVYASGIVTMTGGLFTQNLALSVGGGIRAVAGLNVTGTQFITNTGLYGAGAHTDGPFIMTNGYFERNTASDCAGLNNGYLLDTNSVIISNTATGVSAGGNGGGACLGNGSVLTGTQFIGNSAKGGGGGAYVGQSISLSNTLFSNNTSKNGGGGLVFLGTAMVTNSTFSGNTANDGAGLGTGGGIQLSGSSAKVTIIDSTFTGNAANGTSDDGGGAIMVYDGSLTLTRVSLKNNSTVSHGGGISLLSGTTGKVYLENTLLAGNSAALGGDAISQRVNKPLNLAHTTIVSNTVGATAIEVTAGTTYITNTIIASHTVGINNTGGTVTQNYSLFYGNGTNTSGTVGGNSGSLTGNPAFYDTTAYTLTSVSAAINNGTNAGVTTDYYGNARPLGGGFDIGYHETNYQADLLVSKQVTPSTGVPGDTVTYTVRFTATGTGGVLANIRLTDTMPVSVTNVTVISSGVTVTNTGITPSYVFTVADMAVGQSGIITMAGTISSNLLPTILTNTAQITSTSSEIDGTNNTASISLTVGAAPHVVLINEVVADPQQDWSTNGFNGVVGAGAVLQGTDEWMELYITQTGLNLTGWTIVLSDTSSSSGTLTNTAGSAFQTARYVGTGNFQNTVAGDYLVLGNMRTGAMDNNITLILLDPNGLIVDQVTLNGAASSTSDEAIARVPNGGDTDNDAVDFFQQRATLGQSNDIINLEVSKVTSSLGPVVYHGNVTYTIVVTNRSPITANGVALMDTLPNQIDFTSWLTQNGASVNVSDVITWNGTISPSTVITFGFVATHNGNYGDIITNTVAVSQVTMLSLARATATIVADPRILINEIYARQDSDANGNGSTAAQNDEFIEFVNNTGAPLDLSGWKIGDATVWNKHTFNAGTIIPNGCAVVVFGDGIAVGSFGNSLVVSSDNTSLGLTDTGDTITLKNGNLIMVNYTYGAEGNANRSLTRDPDITGSEPLVAHTTATNSGGRIYSPGTQVNGAAFTNCAPTVLTMTKTVTPLTITRNQEVTYSLVLSNAGLGDAFGATFTDTLPSDVDFARWVMQPSGANVTADTITWTGNISFNQNITMSFVVTHTGSYGDIVANTAQLNNVAASATFTVAASTPPVAVDDNTTTNEDSPVLITVLANDSDIDGNNTILSNSITILTAPMSGTLTVNTNGTITYTPSADLSGVDVFSYTVKDDGNLTSNVAVVTVTVNSQNDVPVANNDSTTTSFNTAVNLNVLANDVLGNNPAIGDQPITLTVGAAANGTVMLNPNLSVTYTPNTGFSGINTFTYTITDSNGDASNVAVVTVTVNPAPILDPPPVAKSNLYTVTQNGVLIVPANGVLNNDTDPQNQPLTATVVTSVMSGTLQFDTNGAFTYTPQVGFVGTDYFIYLANDGTSDSNPATVAIMVIPLVNHPPVVVGSLSYTMTQDTILTVSTITGLLSNVSDPDGDTLTVTLITPPMTGTLQLSLTGSFVYTPPVGFTGTITLTYEVSDGRGGIVTQTATIEVLSKLIPQTNLQVSKSVTPNGQVLPGQIVTYTIYYTNGGPSVAQGVVISDAMLGVNQLLGTLGVSESGRLTLTYQVDLQGFQNLAGLVITNMVMITSETAELDSSDNVAVVTNTVTLPHVDFDRSNYIVNEGDGVAVITLTLDIAPFVTVTVGVKSEDLTATAGLDYQAISQTVIFKPGQFLVTTTVPIMEDSLDEVTETLRLRWQNPQGALAGATNPVTLNIVDNDTSSDVYTPSITLSLSAVPTLTKVGQVITYSYHVTNTGNISLSLVTGHWSLVIPNSSFVIPNLQVGESVTGTFTYTVQTADFPGPIIVTMQVSSTAGIRVATAIATTTVELMRNEADLSLTKVAAPNPVAVNGLLTYTLVVTNNGPDLASEVILTDSLPSEVEYLSSSTACIGQTTLTCTLGLIAPNMTQTITVTVKPIMTGTISNTARVYSPDFDLNMTNNVATATTEVGWVDVRVSMTVTASKFITTNTVVVGSRLTYTVWVTNYGSLTATHLVLTDTMPATMTHLLAASGVCNNRLPLVCQLDDLGPQSSISMTWTVVVTAQGPLTSTVEISNEETDGVISDEVKINVVKRYIYLPILYNQPSSFEVPLR